VLPLLGTNIKCGNSLINRDIYEQLGLFEENGDRIRPFNWGDEKDGFGKVMQAGGFDAMIGNPPYGASFGEKEYAYFRETYKVFRGVKDVYTCFIEAGLDKLKKGGVLSFIVPSAWLGGPEYQPLREAVAQNEIEKIILLPYDVFSDAYVDTTIFVLSKQRPDAKHVVQTFTFGKRDKIEKIDLKPKEYRRVKQIDWTEASDTKFVLDPSTIKLLGVIQKKTRLTFNDVIKIKRGVLFNKELLTTKKTSANSYRYFEGDVYRYSVNYNAKRWIEFDDKMTERPKEFIWFEGQRILLRRLVNRRQRLMASLVNDTFITNKNLYSLLPKSNESDLKVVLGILNSALISHLYINRVTQATKDDFPQVTIEDIVALPYPEIQEQKELQEKLIRLVDIQLGLHKQHGETSSHSSLTRIESDTRSFDGIESDTRSFDARIDKLVYELYGLTEDEIKIIEGE
ncbi:MAG: Eco57I restriction-modification methylase domain-containing protein, partial [Chloroflexi bacterium]|nr:Eco57I restriction-modification methylase domain-containing protein [Chloroflexota bacterium]